MRIGILPLATHKERVIQAVGAALTLAVAVWLGYAFGRGQSLADVSRLYRDADQLDFTLDNGQGTAFFARTGGDFKPVFRAPDGTPLMDYSDWDYNAVVVVDGTRFEMVRLFPSTSVDYAANRVVEGLDQGDWVLSRQITLSGQGADVAFTFTAKRPLHQVDVTLVHANWYFLSATPQADGFVATVPHATRAEVESGEVRTPSYEVQLRATTPGQLPADLVRIGLTTPYGVQSVETEYHLTDPPVGEYAAVATEHLTWRKLQPPQAPA
jgi:hypothetical protein